MLTRVFLPKRVGTFSCWWDSFAIHVVARTHGSLRIVFVMPLARVFAFDAGVSKDESDAFQDAMPKDIYNTPYMRKRAILSGLFLVDGVSTDTRRCNGTEAPHPPAAQLTLILESSQSLDIALAVHDQGLVEYLSSAWERWRALPRDERCKFFQGGECGGDGVPALVPSNCCARQDAINRPGKNLHSQTNFYHTDMDTPIFEGLLPALKADMAVLQGVVNAISRDHNGSGQEGEDAGHRGYYYYALVSHPGHHAGPSSLGGYCYLNNAAILVERLLHRRPSEDEDGNGIVVCGKPLQKIAILDVDYHAGNGTAAVFWSDPDVFVASIHAHPDGDYPWNSCFEDDVGDGAGLGATLCLPLNAGAAWPEYHAALRTALTAIAAHDAQLLVVSLGLDTHIDDPVQEKTTAGIALMTDDYYAMGKAIAGAGLPTVFVQEGGYRNEVAGEIVANLFRGMEDGIALIEEGLR